MSVENNSFSVGDLVLIESNWVGRPPKKESGVITAVIISETENKKFVGPVVKVLIDGTEKTITVNRINKAD